MKNIWRSKRFLTQSRVFSGVAAAHSFVLTKKLDLYGFGMNDQGQLGINSTKRRENPTIVGFFKENDLLVQQAACGGSFSLFLTSSGAVYSCGYNYFGQLGRGDTIMSKIPQKVLDLSEIEVVDVCCGSESSYVLTRRGLVYSFGYNGNGQLGDGTTMYRPSPINIEVLNGLNIVRISAGYEHVAALTCNGALYTWGLNDDYQLGREGNNLLPFVVQINLTTIFSRVNQVLCGGNHTTVVIDRDKFVSFGNSRYGQLGIGSTVSERKAVFNDCLSNYRIEKISLGGEYTLCLDYGGNLVFFGYNSSLRQYLEPGKDNNIPQTLHIKSLEGKTVVDIICGETHSLIVADDSSCYLIWKHEKDKDGPMAMIDGVDLGVEVHVANDLLTYANEEQEKGENGARTTDCELILNVNNEKREIFVNRALLEARCANLISMVELRTSKNFEDVRSEFLNIIYADIPKNRTIWSQMNEFLRFRSISLNDALSILYNEKEISGDVVIKSQNGNLYRAHKFVLIARTSYFHILYNGNWRESSSDLVSLEMSLDENFESYLKYLYEGKRTGTKFVPEDISKYMNYFGMRIKEEEDELVSKEIAI